MDAQFTNMELSAEDPALEALLETYEASTAMLTEDRVMRRDLGHRNVMAYGLAATVQWHERFSSFSGLWYYQNSIPDAYTTPTNFDFASWNLRGALQFEARPRLSLSLTGDHLFTQDKVVSSSVYSPYADPESGLANFSGEGSYFFNMSRISFATHFHPARKN